MVLDTKPEYIGCYSLDELQSQPIKASEVIHDNSPKHCGLWCRARGYTNFLLYDLAPHGITCRCANTLNFKKKRPESECDVAKCPGDFSKGCGSQQRTRVFQFKEEQGIQKWQKFPLPLFLRYYIVITYQCLHCFVGKEQNPGVNKLPKMKCQKGQQKRSKRQAGKSQFKNLNFLITLRTKHAIFPLLFNFKTNR